MELAQLRTLLAVLEHGGFARAAAALRLSQSTVSFQLAQLEAEVGARLVERGGARSRRARPTAAGRTLARYATRLGALAGEALSALRASASGEVGRLRVAASTIPAEYLLPAALASFRRRHPGVEVEVAVSDSRRALAALLDEECELAFVGAKSADRRVAWTEVAGDEVVLVGPSPNPFAPGGRLTRAQLRRTPLIVREEGSGTGQRVRALTEGVTPALKIGSSEAARRCVQAGLGLAFLSRRAVSEELRAGRLSLVRMPGLPLARQFWAARLRRLEAGPAALALIDCVIEKFDT